MVRRLGIAGWRFPVRGTDPRDRKLHMVPAAAVSQLDLIPLGEERDRDRPGFGGTPQRNRPFTSLNSPMRSPTCLGGPDSVGFFVLQHRAGKVRSKTSPG